MTIILLPGCFHWKIQNGVALFDTRLMACKMAFLLSPKPGAWTAPESLTSTSNAVCQVGIGWINDGSSRIVLENIQVWRVSMLIQHKYRLYRKGNQTCPEVKKRLRLFKTTSKKYHYLTTCHPLVHQEAAVDNASDLVYDEGRQDLHRQLPKT